MDFWALLKDRSSKIRAGVFIYEAKIFSGVLAAFQGILEFGAKMAGAGSLGRGYRAELCVGISFGAHQQLVQ